MKIKIKGLQIKNWNDNYYRTECWSDMRTNGDSTRCKSGWQMFTENKCGKWDCRGSTTNWKYRHCWKYNNFLINVGNQTKWDNQLDINVRAADSQRTNAKSNGCSGNTMIFDCEFDIDPSSASTTLIKILTEHHKKKKISDEDYNNFISSYIFTNLGNHKCPLNPKTGKTYDFCPKYFSNDVIEIKDILNKWRLKNPDRWNAEASNFCSRFPNETFCECIGAENVNSIHHDLFKIRSQLGSQIQCFFLPCQLNQTRFTYTQHDDTSSCEGLSCAAFYNLDNDIQFDQSYINSTVQCNGNGNQNENENDNKKQNENEKKKTIEFNEMYIFIGAIWFCLVLLYVLKK